MSEIKVNNIQSLSGTNGPVVSGITTMASSGAMTLPRGDTAYRGGRGRGVFGRGYAPGFTNVMQYITIASTGDAKDFGDMRTARSNSGSASSSTRGIFFGGAESPSPVVSSIDYFTISATGNTFLFGDLTGNRNNVGAAGNNTRALTFGGGTPSDESKLVDYIEIATLGNASTFGELSVVVLNSGACSSSTRALNAGGQIASGTYTNVIDYFTISTLGDAQDFGDLSERENQQHHVLVQLEVYGVEEDNQLEVIQLIM